MQGPHYDGYVKGGFGGTCNAAYSASFLDLKVNGIINGLEVYGDGYGEHVFMSFNKNYTLLQNGWVCHYLHFTNLADLQLCSGFNHLDSSIHGMWYFEKEYWLNYTQINMKPTKYWNMYPIEWQINITNPNIYINTFAFHYDQKINKEKWWIGQIFSYGLVDNIKLEGIGFTEIMTI